MVNAIDVARLAGVSRSAVSRTFTPGTSVAPETRAKVEAAATALGYRPNLIARSLITRKSGIVGLAVGYMANQFYPSLVEELGTALAGIGKRPLLFPVAASGDNDPDIAEVLRYQVDALILASATLSSGLAGECRQRGIPVVLINRVTQDGTCNSVTGDNQRGGRAIGQLFCRKGYQRPAFIAGLEDSSTSREREAAFIAALAEGGHALAARAVGHYDFAQTQAAMRQLLTAKDRPDAVFCANDHMAIAAHVTAQQEFGLTVGRDIAIVGFDDVAMAGWPCFSLTTYSQPIGAMVQAAISLVDDSAANDDTPRHIIVPGHLIERNSTGG
jgi:DNA-binding LacI/PurR family transcriptional regulator